MEQKVDSKVIKRINDCIDRIFKVINKQKFTANQLFNLLVRMQFLILIQWHEGRAYSLSELEAMVDEIGQNVKDNLARNINNPANETKEEV